MSHARLATCIVSLAMFAGCPATPPSAPRDAQVAAAASPAPDGGLRHTRCRAATSSPRPALPSANLSIVRTFAPPAGEPANYLRGVGARFIGFGWPHMVVYSPTASAPEALVPFASEPGGPVRLEGPPPERLSLAPTRSTVPDYTDRSVDGAWLPMIAGTLFAIDQLTDHLRWSVDLYPQIREDLRTGSSRAWLGSAASGGGVIVVATSLSPSAGPQSELVALDARSGRVRWRAGVADAVLTLAIEGARLYVALGETARAFELASGREVWRQPLTPFTVENSELPTLAVSADAVAILQPTKGVRVLDPASGELVKSIPIHGRLGTLHPPAIDGCMLYASVLRAPATPQAIDAYAWALVAFDLGAGVVVWRSDEVFGVGEPLDDSPREPVAIDADTVYACFGDQALRAIDRVTGRTTFTLGLLHGCSTVLLDPDPQGARRIVAVRVDGTAALLERAATPWPAERAQVTGRVTTASGATLANATVIAGDQLTTTDAAGHYDTAVTTRGAIFVHAHRVGEDGRITIVLDGRPTPYRADIVVQPPGPVE